jgi:hypothetical protein
MQPREIILRKTLPVIINSFNQPSYLENIVNKFELNNFTNIIIIDNDSKNPDLLEYYIYLKDTKKYTVLYYNKNNGPRYFHFNYLFNIFNGFPHLFSDPDIDFNILNEDFLSTLLDYSEKYKIFKVGCALEIPSENEIKPDLFYSPPYLDGEKIPLTQWESQFWDNEIEEKVYAAPIDTTLHLFNPKYFLDRMKFISGIRIARKGFIVKHIPWYKSDFINISEREFYKNTDNNWSNY